MGSMAITQAICLVIGCAMQARPAPVAAPLVSRPQVEAAGLTIYWDRNVTLVKNEHILRINRLDENLYATTSQGRVIALDAATGVQRWAVQVADPNIRIAGPTHGPEAVYFTTVQGIEALDRATGEKRLQWRGSFTPTGPVASDGQTMYGGDGDSRLTAISLRDMQIVWEFMTKGLVTSAPILLGPNLFVVSDGGGIYGVAKSDKTQLWPVQEIGPVHAAPAVYGSNLYVAGMRQSLYCFDLVTGQRRWQARMQAPLSISPKATSHGLYQPVPGYGVYSLDPANGQTRWSLPDGLDLLAEQENLVWMMSARSSLLGCDRKDGQVRQEVPCRADMWVSNDMDDAIYVASSSGEIACIRPAGAGFLSYRKMMESAARVSSQPATSQETMKGPKVPPPADYLRNEGSIPPVAGSGRGAAASQP